MKSIIAALALLLVFAVVDSVKSRDGLKQYEAAATAAEQQTQLWQSKYAEASTVVRTNTVQVTKYATRYDTLRAFITDTVIRDSVPNSGTIVPALVAVLDAADSTIAACRDLVNSCERLKIVADSTISAVGLERDAWKKAYQKAKPSKWDKVRPWLMAGAGFYIGAKLRVP